MMKFPNPEEKWIPFLLAILTIVAYGLLLPFTGFYWDDWPFAWIASFQGPKAFFQAFTGVRPFLGPIFFVTTSLIPPVPLYWQIFALLIRFFSGLLAWFALREIWPRHRRQALVASLLFLLFPGYSQHWVALTHINQEWIPFLFYLLSFGLTARALRNPGKFRLYTIWALLSLLVGVFPTEYFITLEPLRFFFIWAILSDKLHDIRQRFIQTLRYWAPYFLIWLGCIAWLAYFYTIGGYGSYGVEVVKNPVTVLQILSTIGEAIWKGGLYAWAQILVLVSESLTAPMTLLTLALIAITFMCFLFYLARYTRAADETTSFAVPAILTGIVGLLLGRLPSFAAGLPLTLQSSNDRFMISMMLGGSLFIVGLIELLIKNPRLKTGVFALLIASSVGQQFFNANIFRRDWAIQQEFFQQLAWRIPAMKPNTTLVTDVLPVDYETDLSFTAPLNWMYAPEYTDSDLPYSIVYTEIRLGGGMLPTLEKGHEIDVGMRTIYFHGSTSQVVVIYMPANGCLRVLDPLRGDQVTYAQRSRVLAEAIPLSDLSNIIVNNGSTAKLPFLAEPEHSWCYYYARAELAYQQQDWKQVIELIDEATSLGYRPEDPFEWLSYIEARALLGDLQIAQEISSTVMREEPSVRKGLCQVWKRVQAEGAARSELEESAYQVLTELQCAP
ncbi:MAG TPA: hypothetical protein VFR47_25455 [Anaerolineales bacterium]|nr:hypothetical protein [Anaerolineales bacterium]